MGWKNILIKISSKFLRIRYHPSNIMADAIEQVVEADSTETTETKVDEAAEETTTTNGDSEAVAEEVVATAGDDVAATDDVAVENGKSDAIAEEEEEEAAPAVSESPVVELKRKATPAKKSPTPGSRVSRRQSNQLSGEKLSEEITDELPKKARKSSVD